MAESGGYIREYLVGLGFEVDEAGLSRFRAALEGAREAARTLENGETGSGIKSALESLTTSAQSDGRALGDALRKGLGDASRNLAPQLKAALSRAESGAAGAFDSLPARFRARFASARAAAEGALSPLTGRVRAQAETTASAFDGLPAQVGATFSQAATAAVSAFQAAVDGIAAQARQIEASVASALSAASRLPSAGGAEAGPVLQNAEGGVYDAPSLTTIAEGGAREYVIPVEKPRRAAPLLRAAMADLGMTAPSAREADILPPHAQAFGALPHYALPQAPGAGGVTHNTSRVEAPVTLNVYGTDAVSTANAVNRTLERRLAHNLRGRVRG